MKGKTLKKRGRPRKNQEIEEIKFDAGNAYSITTLPDSAGSWSTEPSPFNVRIHDLESDLEECKRKLSKAHEFIAYLVTTI